MKLKIESDGFHVLCIRKGKQRSFIPIVCHDVVSLDLPDNCTVHVTRSLSMDEASRLIRDCLSRD